MVWTKRKRVTAAGIPVQVPGDLCGGEVAVGAGSLSEGASEAVDECAGRAPPAKAGGVGDRLALGEQDHGVHGAGLARHWG